MQTPGCPQDYQIRVSGIVWNLHFLRFPRRLLYAKVSQHYINSCLAFSFPLVPVRSKLKSAIRKVSSLSSLVQSTEHLSHLYQCCTDEVRGQ